MSERFFCDKCGKQVNRMFGAAQNHYKEYEVALTSRIEVKGGYPKVDYTILELCNACYDEFMAYAKGKI